MRHGISKEMTDGQCKKLSEIILDNQEYFISRKRRT